MKKIYLVRHGETIENKNNIMIGNSTEKGIGNLTEKGIEQATLLSEYLKSFSIDLIYSSTLKRAVDTAKIINKRIKTNIVLNTYLDERDLGDLIGITREGFEKIWSKQKNKVESFQIF